MENAFSGYFGACGQHPPRHLRYHVVGAYRIPGITRRSPRRQVFRWRGCGYSLPHSVERMTFWGEGKHAHGRRTAISDLWQPSLPVSVFAKERGGGPGYARHRRGEAGGHPHTKESRTSLGGRRGPSCEIPAREMGSLGRCAVPRRREGRRRDFAETCA